MDGQSSLVEHGCESRRPVGSEAGFGELDGELSLPTKFAEAFAFGRENPTGTLDLVMSSPDGESGRPVGKGEC